MKKNFILTCLALTALISCQKETTLEVATKVTDKVATKEPSTPVAGDPKKTAVVNPGNGGGIQYNPSTGEYEANYYGAELVFSPIPNNPTFKEGEYTNVGITCKNCFDFKATPNSAFWGTKPIMSPGAAANARQRVTNYITQWSQYINGDKNPDGTFKQATMPEFYSPSSSSGEFSGIVVRTHSDASTVKIMPATFKPINPAEPDVE